MMGLDSPNDELSLMNSSTAQRVDGGRSCRTKTGEPAYRGEVGKLIPDGRVVSGSCSQGFCSDCGGRSKSSRSSFPTAKHAAN